MTRALQLVMGDAGRMCFDLISSSSELTTDGRLRTYSLAIGGHKRTTGEAGVATIGVFRELNWDYRGN